MPNLTYLECDIMSFEDYKKLYKLRKSLLILASLQVIKGRSKLSNFKGINVARLVNDYKKYIALGIYTI
jgi:hypothetical protein